MHRNAGYTLLELMATVSVVAILAVIGTPALRELLQNNRVSAQTNETVAALNLARSEAVTRGAAVSVCPSTNSTSCSGSTNWASGLIVFIDTGAAGVVNSPNDVILQVFSAATGGMTVTAGQAFLQYLPTGFLNSASSVTVSLRIPHCMSDNNRDITVTPQGFTTLAKINCT